MTTSTLIVRYAMFAVVATAANLLAQRMVLAMQDGAAAFVAALATGTLVGLVIKYALDKRWIFNDRRGGIGTHSKLFSGYALMGVATTLLFWATETVFYLIWGTDLAREIGAVIGLSAGYLIKYQLDARFVFRAKATP